MSVSKFALFYLVCIFLFVFGCVYLCVFLKDIFKIKGLMVLTKNITSNDGSVLTFISVRVISHNCGDNTRRKTSHQKRKPLQNKCSKLLILSFFWLHLTLSFLVLISNEHGNIWSRNVNRTRQSSIYLQDRRQQQRWPIQPSRPKRLWWWAKCCILVSCLSDLFHRYLSDKVGMNRFPTSNKLEYCRMPADL